MLYLAILLVSLLTKLSIGNNVYKLYLRKLFDIDSSMFNEVAPIYLTYNKALERLAQNSNLTDRGFLDDLDNTFEELGKIQNYLLIVADYMRDYKFNEFDVRRAFSSDDRTGYKEKFASNSFTYLENSKFMFAFPQPPLKEDSDVVGNCLNSAFTCLKYIADIAKQNNLIQLKNSPIERQFEGYRLYPFEDYLPMFTFRATASYYLCWHTLNKNPFFKHFNRECMSTSETHLNQNQKHIKFYNEYNDQIEFACAELSFCPDFCCSKAFYDSNYEHFNDNWKERCETHATNPCSKFKDPSCRLSKHANTNLSDLKNNKINFECHCKNGLRYDNSSKQCLDIDECMEGIHDCHGPMQTCLNTYGSFECHCEPGYVVRRISTKRECVLDELFSGQYEKNTTR